MAQKAWPHWPPMSKTDWQRIRRPGWNLMSGKHCRRWQTTRYRRWPSPGCCSEFLPPGPEDASRLAPRQDRVTQSKVCGTTFFYPLFLLFLFLSSSLSSFSCSQEMILAEAAMTTVVHTARTILLTITISSSFEIRTGPTPKRAHRPGKSSSCAVLANTKRPQTLLSGAVLSVKNDWRKL